MLFNKKSPTEEEILNEGLDFAMEFGQNWLKPIQSRLILKFNFLTEEQLNYYNTICESARKDGQGFLYDTLAQLYRDQKNITASQLKDKLQDFILSRYSWISKKNLNHLFSQGCYYAYKDGLDQCIK